MGYYNSMITSLIMLLLFMLMLVSGMLARFYASVPISELRRRARAGDAQASILHEVARNGALAQGVLKSISLLSFVIIVVYISQRNDFFEAVLWIFGILAIYGIALIQNKHIRRLAVMLAPHFALFIVAIRPYILGLAKPFRRFSKSGQHSAIYEMDDLLSLLKNQKDAVNNRIEKTELEMAIHVLTFGDKVVKDYMTPRSAVHFVRTDEPVSTILMSELHDSGFSRFPVYMDEIDNVVGTLYLKDLVEKRMSGKVFSAMVKDVVYISESETLAGALELFLKTKHHLFIVHNQFKEVVGIITIEDIIEQLIGRKIVDESDKHDDMREFALESSSNEHGQ